MIGGRSEQNKVKVPSTLYLSSVNDAKKKVSEALSKLRFEYYQIDFAVRRYNAKDKKNKEYVYLDDAITKLLLRLDKLEINDDVLREDKRELCRQLQELGTRLDEIIKISSIEDSNLNQDLVGPNSEVELNDANNEEAKEVDNTIDKGETIMMKPRVKSSGRWFMKVNIHGTIVHALVDTGATFTFMSKNLFEQLKRHNYAVYEVPREDVMVANGDIIAITKITSILMQIGHKGSLYPVRLLPELTSDLVLGVDIIRSMEIDVDTYNEVWNYRSEPDIKYTFISEDLIKPPANSGLQCLTEEQKMTIQNLLEDAKAMEPEGYTPTTLMEHEIKLTDYTPIVQKPYPVNPKMQQIIEEEN